MARDISTTENGLTVKSTALWTPDRRRAFVGNRRFDMIRFTCRAGNVGSRYTYVRWLITERNLDGSFIRALDNEVDPATIVAAHKVILKYVAKGN